MLYADLPIYKQLYDLNTHILRICLRFNKGYKYTLGDRIQNASLLLLSLLYEVQSGLYDKKTMITKMRVSHEQLIVLLRLAFDMGQISVSDNLLMHPLLTTIGKQLTSRSQKVAANAASGKSK